MADEKVTPKSTLTDVTKFLRAGDPNPVTLEEVKNLSEEDRLDLRFSLDAVLNR